MPQPCQLAILFADISGSTALYDKLGNERALHIVTHTLELLIRCMGEHGGTLVKTIGDEILCTFPDATRAVEAASAMQNAVEQQRPGGEHPVYIRIGVHWGEVIREAGDVYGDAVNVAARITAITRARQIMVSATVSAHLPEGLRSRAHPVMRAEFRGKQEAFEVFHIQWEKEDTLSTRIGLPAFRKPAEARHELLLRYRNAVYRLDEQQKSMILGRGDSCDLVAGNVLASRQHARIDYNFGKFLLTDHSANGTHVRFSDGQAIQLNHQQQIVLHGSGAISLGQPFAEAGDDLIEYLVQ